jgi:uncharacterized protein YigA (DUF484 family)
VPNVIGIAMDVTDRQKREDGIREIHEATREMMQETDRTRICEIAVETATRTLNLSVSTILLVAGPELSDNQQQAEVSQAEQALTQLDAEAARVRERHLGDSLAGVLVLLVRGSRRWAVDRRGRFPHQAHEAPNPPGFSARGEGDPATAEGM